MSGKNESTATLDNKVYQEFYCRVSGEGCGGYITVKINMALDGPVKVICPKCKHEHERYIKGGKIVDDSSRGKKIVQELLPTLAAWSDKPRMNIDIKNGEHNKREFENGNAVIIDPVMQERWFETYGGKK